MSATRHIERYFLVKGVLWDLALSYAATLIPVPEEEHAVLQKEHCSDQSQVAEAKREAEEVDVEQAEVEEKHPRKEADGRGRAHADDAVDLAHPD